MSLKFSWKYFLNELRNFGERPLVNLKIEEVNDDLQFAYKFAASRITSSLSVIDFGCGGGYGAEYLSRFTRNNVVGFDIDADTISQNKVFFKNIKNLTFISDEAKLRRYDIVIFFQVIEHLKIESISLCLEKLKNLLNDSGTIYLATVNKNISSYKLKKPILPFHVYEFNVQELFDLFSKYFRSVKCYGQINQELANKVSSGEWSYLNYYDFGVRNKLIRIISQIELVRFIARHTPLFIKSFILGYGNFRARRVNFKLTDVPLEIENSYILIYEGKK